MSAVVQTVLGPIPSETLGVTLMHEHLLLSSWNARVSDPQWLPVDKAVDFITPVIQDAYQAGVRTIVDVTPYNMGRDVAILQEVSRRTGMQIIASTGIFIDESALVRVPEDRQLLPMVLREAGESVQGLNVRCGAIKCGTGEAGLTSTNQKLLRVCGKAQALTGLPLITHCRPENTRQGLFQQDIFESQGADLKKVVIGHFRKGDPLDYAEGVMRRGSYIAIDQMNFNAHNLAYNLEMIPELIRRGWEEHLIFSHDAVVCFNQCRWSDWDHSNYINYAPDSLSFITRVVIPGLLDRGVTEAQIHTIMVENPCRLLGGGQ